MSIIKAICIDSTIHFVVQKVNPTNTHDRYELWKFKNDKISIVSQFDLQHTHMLIARLESNPFVSIYMSNNGAQIHTLNTQTFKCESSSAVIPEFSDPDIILKELKFVEINGRYYFFFSYRGEMGIFYCEYNFQKEQIGEIKFADGAFACPDTNLIYDPTTNKYWVVTGISIGVLTSIDPKMKVQYLYESNQSMQIPKFFEAQSCTIYDNYVIGLCSATKRKQHYVNSIFVGDLAKLENHDTSNKFEIKQVPSQFPIPLRCNILIANYNTLKYQYLISGYIKSLSLTTHVPKGVQLIMEKFYAYKKKIYVMNGRQNAVHSISLDNIINKYLTGEEFNSIRQEQNSGQALDDVKYDSIEIVDNASNSDHYHRKATFKTLSGDEYNVHVFSEYSKPIDEYWNGTPFITDEYWNIQIREMYQTGKSKHLYHRNSHYAKDNIKHSD
eukprot:115178_1